MKKELSILTSISLITVILLFQGCKKATAPELDTVTVSEVTQFTAVSGGNITSDGGEEILQKGVCWSITENPTIASSITSDGNGSTAFTSNMVGLSAGTKYYVRAYATNSVGTGYGNEVSFTTNQVTGAILTTTEVTNVTSTTALSGGNITDAGGGTITAKGVCWNTSPSPTVQNFKTDNGTGPGIFTSNITGLTDGVIYYYRAYATNNVETTYGQEYQFITPVTDIEGNIYKTVVIGNQVWMAENLKVTKFKDNADISNVDDATDWINMTSAGYCWYNNDEEYHKPLYGALYNWFAANNSNLCPEGWHVPSDAEFNALELTLGLPQEEINIWGWRGTNQGSQMKNSTGWNAGENGSNSSGFSALPGGYRNHASGAFNGRDILSYWWSASDDSANGKPEVGWYRRLDGTNNGVYKASTTKTAGKYIRCVKN